MTSPFSHHPAHYTADVVVIGAGAAGALAAYDLSSRGHRVLMIDAGPRIDRVAAVNNFRASPTKGSNSAFPENAWAPVPDDQNVANYYVQTQIDHPWDQLVGLYLKAVGGTTWHMTAHAERLVPNDFRMESTYGRGLDWPIGYDDLEPYYTRVEREWGVAGENGVSISPDRHNLPYPMPAIPPTWLDHQVALAAQQLNPPLTVAPFPHARNSTFYDNRVPCCGNANCNAICPVAAKYDASVHVAKAEAAGARLLDSAVVYAIDVNPDPTDDRVSAVRFRRADGSEGIATGKVFILAAHAIETPKLLLMSKNWRTPNGVANRSDQVGRNLMSQLEVTTSGIANTSVYPYRGPVSATSGILEYRDGPHRHEFAAFGTFILNGASNPRLGPLTLANNAIDSGLLGSALRRAVSDTAMHEVAINCAAEVLPNSENRVTPDDSHFDALGMPYPNIRYKIDEYTLRGIRVATRMQRAILNQMGDTTRQQPKIAGAAAVITGTARMGTDPAHSVVDSCSRSHDHRNLYIVGTCNYPTSGFASPTLTAAALALRAAAQIDAGINQG